MKTDNELHDLIEANEQAKAWADAGNDLQVVDWLNGLGHKVVVTGNEIKEKHILDAFTDPADGEVLLQKLEAVALVNPIFKRMAPYLKADAKEGLDPGKPSVRAAFTALRQSNVITQTELDKLLGLGERPVTYSAADIPRIWSRYRINGNIVPTPGV